MTQVNTLVILFFSTAPSKHINDLFGKWETAIKEKDGAEATIKTVEANHKAELATQAANLKQEMSEKIAEAREKARLEGEFCIFTHLCNACPLITIADSL